ncbi:MAG TPA: LLM class flavin-dependent oxidoreductase [Dehalococcoidia bacterium]|nr:LLM class flavin-dependent oxidoreductase [Dehalococcoidia bacterium]
MQAPRSGFVATVGTVREIAALAAEGERLGYESAWVAETAGYDVVSLLTAMAASTSRMQLGTGIAGVYLRSPLLMAMSANAVNEFSGGRLLLGLGTSTPVIVERWHGLPWSTPLGHMRAYTELVRRLLGGERIKSDGPYALNGAQLVVPAAGVPPIYFGALNDGMLALAGAIADGVILNFPTLSYAGRAIERVRKSVAEAGRDPAAVTIAAFIRTTVTETPDSAFLRERYERELIQYALAPVYRRVFSADGYGALCDRVNALWAAGQRAEALAALTPEFLYDHTVVGPPADCAARLQAFRELGVDNVVLLCLPDNADDPLGSVRHSITALAPVART